MDDIPLNADTVITVTMGIFRRSLAEDNIDRYNHTYFVIFLLCLSLASLLFPTSFVLQRNQRVKVIGNSINTLQYLPKVKTHCMTPLSFSESHVKYAHSVCGARFVNLIRGYDGYGDARLYEIDLDNEHETMPTNNMTEFKPMSAKNKMHKEKEMWHFITVIAPVSLFVLAVGLKIPHVLYLLLISLVGAMNVDKNLEEAVRVERKEGRYHSRRLVASRLHESGRAAGSLYLLHKVMVFVVVFVALLVVKFKLLSELVALKNDFRGFESLLEPDFFLVCRFKLHQLQGVAYESLQCLFNIQGGQQIKANIEVDVSFIESYETIFLMVQTSLIALNVINAFSLFVWMARLTAPPCRKNITDRSSLPLDAIFLLQMARENVGPEVGLYFLKGDTGTYSVGASGAENIPLQVQSEKYK